MRCKRTACQKEGATCRHTMTGDLYCRRCARLINETTQQILVIPDGSEEPRVKPTLVNIIDVEAHYGFEGPAKYWCACAGQIGPGRIAAYHEDRLEAVGRLVEMVGYLIKLGVSPVKLDNSISINTIQHPIPGRLYEGPVEPYTMVDMTGRPVKPIRRDGYGNIPSPYDLNKAPRPGKDF